MPRKGAPRKRKPPPPVLMTERRIRNYLKAVYKIGRSRCQVQGEKFSPACFAAGAGVLFAYLGRMDLLPAEWVFGLMLGNRNPFAPRGD